MEIYVKDAYRHVGYLQVTGGDICLVATQDKDYFEAEHMLCNFVLHTMVTETMKIVLRNELRVFIIYTIIIN